MNISQELIQKYSVSGPRYTSYPTAPEWNQINLETQEKWYQSISNNNKPIALYIHIPFCEERCTYCACNVIITPKQSISKDYISFIIQEIKTLSTFVGKRVLQQIHFGGGTPTFLLNEEFDQIFNCIETEFEISKDCEISIEIDPRKTRAGQIEFLYSKGFNRISMGVQDFDEEVQKNVNRIQSFEITKRDVELCKKLGFHSINLDLVYGLPKQTPESFYETLQQVIELKPDRFAIYHFAYLPKQLPYHRRLNPEDLPSSKVKLDIFSMIIQQLTDVGYIYIGMDHFALPEDELAIALNKKTLSRNFMGYTTKPDNLDLFGVGTSSIGEFSEYYIQNEKKLNRYQNAVQQNGMAGVRGKQLTLDDRIRKWTIQQLICNFYLSFKLFQQKFHRNFLTYFEEENKQLHSFIQDNLLVKTDEFLEIKEEGKLFVRNICMVFDAYLTNKKTIQFSKTM